MIDTLQGENLRDLSGENSLENYHMVENLFDCTEPVLTANTIAAQEASSTGIMLSTLWNQSGILKIGNNSTITYNEYCPLDGSSHSLTGCTNTAAAQIIYYHIEKFNLKLNLTLTSDDEYLSFKDEYLSIKADGSTPGTISFAQINAKLADYDLNSADDAAALLYACGVVQHANYSASATSTAWSSDLFYRAGFVSCNDLYLSSSTTDYWGGSDGNGGYRISDAGYEVLIENLQAGRVVGTSYPGHALVIDGYDSVNDKFHINFGWGNSASTAWYSREDIYEQQYYHFVYDLMTTAQETLTVNDMDVYGTGTLVRAFEMARSIKGSNTINFAATVAGKNLTLSKNLAFKEKITVNNFSINLTVAQNYAFYGNSGVTADFKNFTGALVANASDTYYGFYFYNADRFDFSGSGAIVYCGNYTVNGDYNAGSQKILDSLQNSRKNNLAVENFIIDNAQYSFYTTTQNDSIILNNRTLVVGNINMSSGNDELKVLNNSRVYGNIDMGDGSNTVTIDSTSSIICSGVSRTSALKFALTSTVNSSAMLTLSGSIYNLKNYWTVSVDISKATDDVYTLITTSDIINLKNIDILITGTGEADYKLNFNNNADGKHADLLFENNSLKLNVKGYDSSDKTPPSTPGNLKATVYGSGVSLDWSNSADNKKVDKYFYRYGKSSTLSGNGTAVKNSEARLTELANGTYYYQVRAVDASGNYSNWSEVKSFTVNFSATPAMLFQSGMLLSSGTILTGKHLGNQHSMFISGNGSAVSTYISSGGILNVSNGGFAKNTTVCSGGSLHIYRANANSVTVSGGKATVSSAVISNVSIKNGGALYFSSHGSAVNAVISEGGIINGFEFQKTATITNFRLETGINDVKVVSSAFVYSGMTVRNIDVNKGKKLYIYSGGTAHITYNPWSGSIISSTGAVVSRAQRDKNVYFGGSDHGVISAGNNLNTLNVVSGLSALVYSGGMISSAIITNGGSAVFSGGSAKKINISSGGKASQYSGTIDSWTVLSNGSAYIYGSAKNAQISGGYAVVSGAGAAVDNIGIISAGRVFLNNGAKIGHAAILSGNLYISNNGAATGISLSQKGAYVTISNGAVAGTLSVSNKACATISSGGKAETVNITNYGSATISSGANVNSLVLSGGGSAFFAGKAASAVVGSCGNLFLSSGSTINKITVASAGRLYLASGYINSNITMERGAVIIADKEVSAQCDITINGRLDMSILNNGSLDMQNHTLTLDLRERFVDDAYLIDDLSLISNYNLTVSVAANQNSGKYELARGASDFSGSVKVTCGNLSGNLSVGSTLTLGNSVYGLTVSGNLLSLDVANTNYTALPQVRDYTPGTWSTDWKQASEYARKNNKIIFACYGDPSRCTYAGYMHDKLLRDPEFLTFAKKHLVLLYETTPARKTYSGSPAGCLLTADGDLIARKNGFASNDYAEWMSWLKLQTGINRGIFLFSSGNEQDIVSSYSGNASNLNVSYPMSMYINGVTLFGGTVYSGGYAYVQNNGIASNMTIESGGQMHIKKNGTANNAVINSQGRITVYSGGTANRTTMNAGAFMALSNGAIANNTNILVSARLLLSGGTANNTDLKGSVYVYSGGVADNTRINSGYTVISSGGVAKNTVINSTGRMYVYSGGTADTIEINSSGYMYISSAGLAKNIAIDSGARIYIYSGGTLGGAMDIESGAKVSAYNGATIDFTVDGRSTSNSWMIENLASITGTPSYSITVDNGCLSGNYKLAKGAEELQGLSISIGDNVSRFGTITVNGRAFEYNNTAYTLTLNNGCLELNIKKDTPVQLFSSGTCVYVGKTVSHAALVSGGNNSMVISNGGKADNTTIGHGGKMLVSNGGVANTVTVSSQGLGFIYNGGTISSATVNSGGALNLYYGGKVNTAKINAGGKINVSNGGIITKTTVYSKGQAVICAGGRADSTTIDNFGSMYISSGGQANSATVYYLGELYVGNGGKLNNGIIRFGKAFVSSGGIANNTVVSSGGLVFVSSGGKMETATVSSGGWIHLYYGGFANNATVNGFGRFYVSNAASASKVTVNSNGLGFIYAGGKMNSASVKKGGAIHVYGGGTANSAAISGGKIFVYQNGQISGNLLQSGGTALISSGGKAINTTVGYNGSMHLCNGAAASSTTVNYLGRLTIDKGAKAAGTTIKFGKVFVSSGASVSSTTVSSGGLIFVSSGGKMETAAVSSGGWIHLYYGGYANNATVNAYGRFYVSNAASANKMTVNSNGLAFVYAGGKMNNATVKSGGLTHVYGGGKINTASLNGGKIFVSKGAAVDKVTVSAGGLLHISSGGTAANTTVGFGKAYVSTGANVSNATIASSGLMFVYKGGKMDNTTVQTKGGMHLYTGATHRGTLQIWSGATVSAYSGATIDFTISRRKAADTAYFINDLSRINGAPNYTVTVSDYQETGVYELAQGASSFTGSVTVGNGKVNFGKVAVGKTLNYGGKSYTLQKNGSDLTMAITKLPASAAPWDAVAEASSEVAMPAGTQECLWESASPAPAAENALAFPEIASGTAADLSIWQNFEANGCVSTLTENNQPINKFELLA